MHVVVCQTDIAWEDHAANHARVVSVLSKQTIRPGSLIVLPEMFDTGFTMNVDAAADDDGRTRRFLSDLARTHLSAVIAGVVQKHPDGKGLNQAVVIGPKGNELTRYTKMHPFSPAGESEHYRAGDSVITFQHAGFTLAPLVCYDLRFPERFREAVRLGADAFVVIANWPDTRAAHWTALLTARAIENQAYVIGVNRAGHDPKHAYPGLSTVIDPKGHVIAQADDKPAVIHADLDRDALMDYRRAFPFLNDMRG
jgi:predicted amidohydrolase